MKTPTYQWTNGKRSFPGFHGTKYGLAWDLIVCKEIRLTPKDIKELKLKSGAMNHVATISAFKAARFLENKGWRWEKRCSETSVSDS